MKTLITALGFLISSSAFAAGSNAILCEVSTVEGASISVHLSRELPSSFSFPEEIGVHQGHRYTVEMDRGELTMNILDAKTGAVLGQATARALKLGLPDLTPGHPFYFQCLKIMDSAIPQGLLE